jgi:signal transduction histidine kinase
LHDGGVNGVNARPVNASPLAVGWGDGLRGVWRARSVRRPRGVLIGSGGGALIVAAIWLAAVSPPAPIVDIVVASVAVGLAALALGLYATANHSAALPIGLLADAGAMFALWLLLASLHPLAFTVGWLLAGLLVPLVGYAVLASIRGRGDRSATLLFVAGSAAVAVAWVFIALTSRQPSLFDPLARCVPHCPRNELFAGSAPSALATVARAAVWIGWVISTLGVALYVARRFKAATTVARRGIAPTLVLATAYTVAVLACVVIGLAASDARAPLVWVLLAGATLLPVAMLAGLVSQRLFLGKALEEFMNALPDEAPQGLPGLLAHMLHDPSLQIGYARRAAGGYVDLHGAALDLPDPGQRRVVTAVSDDGLPDMVVIQQEVVPDQKRFLRAAVSAALISRENRRLEDDLSASTVELEASRKRLARAAYTERQRIERDMHDGIQQRMVGARVKLELADDALDANPARGRRMLAEIGCDLDDAVEEVRSLAHGVYPALLETHGLLEALRSAARRSPGPVVVRGDVGRYAADTEAAIYFCCLETLQNVAKHAGRDAMADLRLWEDGGSLIFQTSDSGGGFAVGETPQGQGLLNMHDRLATVGGTLSVRSGVSRGTVVKGCVPIA